jgi:DNA repair protein RecN (Recombination protein N)
MLNFLQIRNFAIVESLDLEFSGGFTCITGETGAGKSILVDALGLLCGNRADTSTVRAGSDRAELSAEFELQEKSPALHWLREADLDDGQLCLLRRTISETGRSRAWINGTAVTLQQLQGLGAQLVEIHGQNEHMQLIRSREQFRLLDESGQYAKALCYRPQSSLLSKLNIVYWRTAVKSWIR